jgi:hypothetical protein
MLTYTTIKNVPGYENFKKAICNMPIERLQKNIKIFDDFLSSKKKFFMSSKKDARMNRNCVKEYVDMLNEAIETRFPQSVKENETRFVSKKLPENLLTTPAKKAKFNSLNETNNTNSKGDKTMKKNTQIEELTTLVKHLTARIEMLEKGERPKFKKLRERSEQKVESVKKVEPKKKATKNPQVTELQKKAKEMKGKMTKNQLSVYGKLWSKKWQFVNKSIDITKKDERSMACAKGRIECAKKAMALDI